MSSSTRPTDSERADLESLHLRREAFHGEWNYSFLPRPALLRTGQLFCGSPLERMQTLPAAGKLHLAGDRGFM